MRKPPGPSPELRRKWFGGAPNQGHTAEPMVLVLDGPTTLSRSLPLSHPDFGGCRWPVDGGDTQQLFCCAPAKERFCKPHSRQGVIAIPASGKGSVDDLIKGVEHIL